MANNYIPVDLNKRLGYEVQKCADLGAQLRHHLEQVQSVIENMHDGVTYSTVEAATGCPAGKGGDLAYLLLNARDSLAAAAALNQLINWLGGVTG